MSRERRFGGIWTDLSDAIDAMDARDAERRCGGRVCLSDPYGRADGASMDTCIVSNLDALGEVGPSLSGGSACWEVDMSIRVPLGKGGQEIGEEAD